MLRADSTADASRVQEIAAELRLSYTWAREDVQDYAQANSLSIEEAARIVRYRFLFQQAQVYQAQAVAVAHTADDQVETVLMHLLRGSGMSGISGMDFRSLPNPWSHQIPLIRPLLGVWRAEVQAYLIETGLQPCLDSTNLDTRYYRNRLRHELIPYLQSYNTQVSQHIWRMAELLGQDEKILEEITDSAWRSCLSSQGAGYLVMDAMALRDHPLGIQRRLMRRAVQSLRPGLRDFDYAAVERAIRLVTGSRRKGACDLSGGIHMSLENEKIWLATWEAQIPATLEASQVWPQIPMGSDIILTIPSEITFSDGWRLKIESAAADPEVRASALANPDPYQAWLDADIQPIAQSPLRLRTRLPGDRFQPLGLSGHSLKLSDFFINTKLPQRARAGWPLIVCEEKIAWIPGFRLAHDFRLRHDTRHINHLQLLRA